MNQTTVFSLLERHLGSRVAFAAPDRSPLDHEGLRRQVAETGRALADLGIGRGDRVAIVLPNGPEAASSFLAIAAWVSTAPLNPAYKPDEFAFYLDDLRAAALIVAEGDSTPALAVARDRRLPVLSLRQGPKAGQFSLQGASARAPTSLQPTAADDEALVLHTSGTTSRPKIVPLCQRNLAASARHIAVTLALSGDDRCLNVMPLFHIHGLIAAVLSSLSVGGSVYCTPGFNALKFFAWLDDAAPSWYTAVPTMHQALLARAERNADVIARRPLRFIRSSSASLPPPVMLQLEKTFHAPVIESYGMTEAAHQMASNPLPPRARKPGSVGPAAGPAVAIMDEAGRLQASGVIGEVVIRGPNVTKGYENNPNANAEAFTDGWFRTGDQGVIDGDGYLTITGRIKELINRGGEKISPREVDDVLLDHPAVAQAVTFAMPHAMLGEDIAAAVVLRNGQKTSERDLRDFVGERLTAFKVPRKIVFLEEIPKGATGKVQRIGLATRLGLAGNEP